MSTTLAPLPSRLDSFTDADAALRTTGGREIARRKLHNNTYLERDGHNLIHVQLHSTFIVTYDRTSPWVTIRTGGWHTLTTRDRLSRYSPAKVWGRAPIKIHPDGTRTSAPLELDDSPNRVHQHTGQLHPDDAVTLTPYTRPSRRVADLPDATRSEMAFARLRQSPVPSTLHALDLNGAALPPVHFANGAELADAWNELYNWVGTIDTAEAYSYLRNLSIAAGVLDTSLPVGTRTTVARAFTVPAKRRAILHALAAFAPYRAVDTATLARVAAAAADLAGVSPY